tara:strand:- start:14521 stop:15624 length:1104 start_codon:yes stop_codon:yes gene_type:complete
MSKIIIFGSSFDSLYKFRGDLINDFVEKGHKVTTISGYPENIKKNQTPHKHIFLNFKRNRITFFNNFLLILKFIIIIYKEKPNIVLSYTIKPVIIAGLCQYIFSYKFFPMITGLGNTFYPKNFREQILRYIIHKIYKISISKKSNIIFQNTNIKEYFINYKLCYKKQNNIVTNGSGVNLNLYPFSKTFPKTFTFLMIARIIKPKGIIEYIEACNLLKKKQMNIIFKLIGPYENSSYSLTNDEIKKLNYNNAVECIGFKEDITNEIKECSVFVLPSYHEGMPRSVLEALSIGRPIITTNIPGAKETVKDKINGFLIEKENTLDLLEKMKWFIDNQDSIKKMGYESFKLALEKFNVKLINKKIINFMDL